MFSSAISIHIRFYFANAPSFPLHRLNFSCVAVMHFALPPRKPDASVDDEQDAVNVLLAVASNIVKDPTNEKFRSVKRDSAPLKRVAGVYGDSETVSWLVKLGFELGSDGRLSFAPSQPLDGLRQAVSVAELRLLELAAERRAQEDHAIALQLQQIRQQEAEEEQRRLEILRRSFSEEGDQPPLKSPRRIDDVVAVAPSVLHAVKERHRRRQRDEDLAQAPKVDKELLLTATSLVNDIGCLMEMARNLDPQPKTIVREDRIEARRLLDQFMSDVDIERLHATKSLWEQKVAALKQQTGKATVFM